MELAGVAVPTLDQDLMVDCLIEEYLSIGWEERQVLELFRSPFFQTTHRVFHERGEDYVRGRVDVVRARWQGAAVQGRSPDGQGL